MDTQLLANRRSISGRMHEKLPVVCAFREQD